jgi:hypothetical protein
LAAFAETSISLVDTTVLTEARSEEVRREISRRHSVARALNIVNEMRRELKTNVEQSNASSNVMTHARERGFERAFRLSDLTLFWSSSLNF